jgi:hypothetical protein
MERCATISCCRKISKSANDVIVSYCCGLAGLAPQAVLESRRRLGWVNSFDRTEFIQLFSVNDQENVASPRDGAIKSA